ncbi:hypothetical protein SLA2020_414100 [Shorea laevis]
MPDQWTGSIWARTKCSFNASYYFSCETGDCGSGIKECQYPPPALLVTLLNFEIKLPVVSYEVSLKHGHNVPVRIRPDGGSLVGGAGPCPVVDCGQVTTCRSMANKDGRYIGCYSACDEFKIQNIVAQEILVAQGLASLTTTQRPSSEYAS